MFRTFLVSIALMGAMMTDTKAMAQDVCADNVIIIAHRGASGERPEHTLASYNLAIDQGADYIEPDLVSTRDGHLVARHENDISETTDVAERAEFADRKTTKTIDFHEITGWFIEDFTLSELRTLRALERLPLLREANMAYNGLYQVPTLEEIIELVRKREVDTGRRIGIYPEIKHPTYFANLGLGMEEKLVKTLHAAGYKDASEPIFIQSFETGNLRALDKITDLRLVQLIHPLVPPYDLRESKTQFDLVLPEGLADIASYADAIGPGSDLIIPRDKEGRSLEATSLIADAHAAGLDVHPWTIRRENLFLPTELQKGDDPRETGDIAAQIKQYIALGVDGLFSDNPREAVRIRDEVCGQ